MGCAASAPIDQDPAAKQRNDEIDKSISQEKKKRANENRTKLLVLGAGESGKSTILKQMTLIYGTGFTPNQLETFRQAIQINILVSIVSLIKAMDKLRIPFGFKKPVDADEATRRLAAFSTNLLLEITVVDSNEHSMDDVQDESQLKSTCEEGRSGSTTDPIADLSKQEFAVAGGTDTHESRVAALAREFRKLDHPSFGFNLKMAMQPETIAAIKEIWNDPGIQYCYTRANEFQLMDSCAYVMQHIDRISSADFVPTNEDVLNARIMTVGVHESNFKVGGMMLTIYDVGGQRSERKKWAQYFDDTQAILFLVAVSAYDQSCMEDDQTNRVVESMNLFSSICNHPLFKKTDMVLFLNKIDLFQTKIETRPISLYFQDYTGAPNSVQESAKYFIKRFQAINKYPNDKQIYPHLTHATDTNMTKKVLESVFESILKGNMEAYGMV
ncbi:guanine nucleotide binding protein, alpha subunit [Rhizoclosmatium globosum]|uniref:Guanine nucleotide binding protein, alpha subunit n=1 Tax=Rhizoclosmatium globosum TaxID=329046 RepID=A0A1Y2BQ28_9FUNG|nr:guanine nucleotide binding protein, alpha subunit [Rhizoclosmatium globosum]|eukprot:ORY36848.1 guanine nucleotide binding protein, alpha subunit [Rhizoclosmatium globosum]